MHKSITVQTDAGGRDVPVAPADAAAPLTRVLRKAELALNTRCDERGLCDGCLVDLVDADGSTRRVRACELRADDPALDAPGRTVRIPHRSLLAHRPQVVSDFRIAIPWADEPLWAGECDAGQPLGLAIDIGTTTVTVALVELAGGAVLGRASAFNSQSRFGDNVLTRINRCLTEPAMVKAMQTAVIRQTIRPLIDRLLDDAPAGAARIKCITIAGNATMLHLAAGVNPGPMGMAPFPPAFIEHRVLGGRDLGLGFDADVHLLPGAAAYVGADLVAGCLVSGQVYHDRPALLVDVGTNGEIALRHGEQLLGCATAAGPAFEGAGLSSGMRAAHGAIEHVRFDGDDRTIACEVIGHAAPAGICGSAYIDLLARGRAAGLINPTGRLTGDHRAIETANGYGKRLRFAGEADQAVAVTEADLATLLQAKAAIAAGITTLLHRIELDPARVDRVYLAGGFGMHIDPASAVGCGLLPGFRPDQIQAIGNASLAGAYLALLDRTALDELTAISRRIDVVELNLDPHFEMNFIEQLTLPDPRPS